ncbi:hypothetical protein [Lucifera butyrica]|nr:hypothetical protein [Lucifera butyrica]
MRRFISMLLTWWPNRKRRQLQEIKNIRWRMGWDRYFASGKW